MALMSCHGMYVAEWDVSSEDGCRAEHHQLDTRHLWRGGGRVVARRGGCGLPCPALHALVLEI